MLLLLLLLEPAGGTVVLGLDELFVEGGVVVLVPLEVPVLLDCEFVPLDELLLLVLEPAGGTVVLGLVELFVEGGMVEFVPLFCELLFMGEVPEALF